MNNEIKIQFEDLALMGFLDIPENAKGIVLFAHGSGSSRFSERNNFVAKSLRNAGLATLLMDLLTEEEEKVDIITREHRFNIPMLAERVVAASNWLIMQIETKDFNQGYFGASTGAAAALIAAAELPEICKAVVSRGGRPDLADVYLDKVKAPTLLIVGGDDEPVIGMNREALAKMNCEKELEIIPGATHLFEESGKLEQVAELTTDWFLKYLT